MFWHQLRYDMGLHVFYLGKVTQIKSALRVAFARTQLSDNKMSTFCRKLSTFAQFCGLQSMKVDWPIAVSTPKINMSNLPAKSIQHNEQHHAMCLSVEITMSVHIASKPTKDNCG